MDLTSDHPWWFVKNGLLNTYPFLTESICCDVAVIGAGVTGAMVAYRLASIGHSVVVLDGRDVTCGSTSASTALLQYEIDVSLTEMADLLGEDKAVRAYRVSHDSIDRLEQLVNAAGAECGFRRKKSIQIAQTRKQALALANEHRARKVAGLNCQYHNAEDLRNQFGLNGIAALSNDQAASCDAYQMANAFLRGCQTNGGQIFDRTQVTKFECSDSGVTLQTSRDATVSARKVVIAAGYEAQSLLRETVVNLDNTYAVVSQPLKSVTPWNSDWMLWETGTPYLYLRCTDDHRILVGGEDDRFHSPGKRDASVGQKSKVIHKKIRELLPDLGWEVEFAWAGTFGKTKDGLAYIGESPEYPGCIFTLGFGGNGITFSMIATDLITEFITGHKPENADLFRFGR